MKCALCQHGTTVPGKTTMTLERHNTLIVYRDVPAEICRNCGEAYLDETVTGQLLDQAETAAQTGVEVEILRYAA